MGDPIQSRLNDLIGQKSPHLKKLERQTGGFRRFIHGEVSLIRPLKLVLSMADLFV